MTAAPLAPAAADVRRLARGASALAVRPHAEVAGLAAACRRALAAEVDAWVVASTTAKGWQQIAGSATEEWASGPVPIARFLSLVQQLHADLAHGRQPALRTLPAAPGGTSFAALPAPGLCDALLLAGCRARVDTDPGTQPHAPARRGDVALVLGAGNVTATPVLDVLHQVFLEGRAVLLKLSPLHARIAPCVERALRPLVQRDLLAVVCGDGALGAELAALPGLAAVHLTGSTATWQALRAAPARADRVLSAEVGCCTPVLVLPGPWRERQLRHTAHQLAVFVACNGGATCLAPRLLLTARGWPQRSNLLAALRDELAALPARVPFHPGARTAFAAATGGEATGEALRPTLRTDLDPARDGDLCTHEHFAPVLLEMPLPGDALAAWLDRASAFVRDQVFGSLAAYVFAPKALGRTTIDAAVRALPHGTIAVNCWAGLGYGLGTTPWGVPAGRPWQHGAGWTRGTAGLTNVRRVVVQAPLRPIPLPPWLRPHRDGAATLRALTHHYLRPSIGRLAATAAHALRSP